MTEMPEKNDSTFSAEGSLSTFSERRSPKLYAALLVGAAVVGGGVYLVNGPGLSWRAIGNGRVDSQASLDGELRRVKELAAVLKSGAAGREMAAREILEVATRIRLAQRQADLPELDSSVAAAGQVLLQRADGPDAQAYREQARFALTLINLASAKVNLAYELVQRSANKDETFFLLGIARAGLKGLPPERQDEVRAGMAKVLARKSVAHAAEAAFLQSSEIRDPARRAKTLHEVALLRMEMAVRAQPSERAAGGVFKKSDGALISAARQDALDERVLPAMLLALSINDVTARDRMLQFIVHEGAKKEDRWKLLPAIFGISNTSVRDDVSLRYIYRATNDGYLAEAQQVSDAIIDSDLRTVSQTVIAEALADLGYAKQVDEVLPSLSQIKGLTGGSREIAASYAAAALATLGRNEAANDHLALVTRPNRTSTAAATEIAENLSRQSGQFDQIRNLLRYVEPDEHANLSARAAIALARVGDATGAMRYIDSIENVGVKAKAAALFALETRLPDAWLQLRTVEADRLQPSLGDRSGILAALATARGKTNEAIGLLAASFDEQLGSRISNELARQLASTGRVKELRKIPLVGSGDKQKAKDALLRSAALALADRGMVDRASYLAREMTDYKTRVATMRAIAVSAAREADTHKALDGTLQAPPEADPAATLDAPLVRRRSFNIYDPGSAKMGSAIPTLPNASIHTSSSVLEKVPAVKRTEEPSFSIVPLANNGYNKKFLTARSAFEEVVPGGPTVIMRSQGTSYPVYLHLDSGVIDLPTLYNRLLEQGFSDILQRNGRIYTLRVPLFVANDAKLIVSDASVDELRLSNERAAYLVSAGEVFFTGVKIVGWGESINSPSPITEETKSNFRPFYIAWSNSVTYSARSKFQALGYSSGKSYGFSFSGGPLGLMSVARVVREPKGVVVDSTFEDMLYGFYSWEAADVAIVGNEYRNNLIYGIDPHDWSKRLLVAYNTAYGSHKKHGIIGSRHVEDSWFIGNVSFGNHGSGLMMDRYSGRNIIYANYSFDNHGNGVAIYESPCNLVSSNRIFRNNGNGVFVRNSWDVGVFNNDISENGKLGVNAFFVKFETKPGAPARNLEIDPYERFVTMAVVKNKVANNKDGAIGAQGVGATQLKSNVLIGNPKRAYIGDLRNVEFDIVRQGGSGILVGGSCPKPKITYVCTFANQGYLHSQLMAAASAKPLYRSCPTDTTVNLKTSRDSNAQSAEKLPSELEDGEVDGAQFGSLTYNARKQVSVGK